MEKMSVKLKFDIGCNIAKHNINGDLKTILENIKSVICLKDCFLCYYH